MKRVQRLIEHVTFCTNDSYPHVVSELEARLGTLESQKAVVALMNDHASWEQISHAVSENVGSSGFVLFAKVDHGQYLALLGKQGRAIQYALGNPLQALQMTSSFPEVGLYAPLRLLVHEKNGATFIEYDSLCSQVASCQDEEISRVAQLVEQQLEALITAVLKGREQP